jgi:hypothetical protein
MRISLLLSILVMHQRSARGSQPIRRTAFWSGPGRHVKVDERAHDHDSPGTSQRRHSSMNPSIPARPSALVTQGRFTQGGS